MNKNEVDYVQYYLDNKETLHFYDCDILNRFLSEFANYQDIADIIYDWDKESIKDEITEQYHNLWTSIYEDLIAAGYCEFVEKFKEELEEFVECTGISYCEEMHDEDDLRYAIDCVCSVYSDDELAELFGDEMKKICDAVNEDDLKRLNELYDINIYWYIVEELENSGDICDAIDGWGYDIFDINKELINRNSGKYEVINDILKDILRDGVEEGE